MDLGDVYAFLEVTDAGGVSSAARELGASKSIPLKGSGTLAVQVLI